MQNKNRRDKYDGELVNERIRFNEVLVIDQEGNKLGVMSSSKAFQIAKDEGFDLMCVSPNTNPPVCKILDYGKYRFQKQKKAKEAKKNQKIIETKEIQLSIKIGEHDLLIKAKKANECLLDGNKVKVVVRFRGRELNHPEIGEDVMKRFLEKIQENGVVEKEPTLEGRVLNAVVASKTKK